uniref:Uncharacterized protein n=1 Tax=Syphacia muris TaxID=451379 RepID=A0A0N5B0X7_9BILA
MNHQVVESTALYPNNANPSIVTTRQLFASNSSSRFQQLPDTVHDVLPCSMQQTLNTTQQQSQPLTVSTNNMHW